MAANESARDGRKRQHATAKRTELEYLEHVGYEARTTKQDRRYDYLNNWNRAPEMDKAEIFAAEVGDDNTGLSRINTSLRPLAHQLPSGWTTTHGFFVLMGGFHQFNGENPMRYFLPRDVVSLVSAGLLAPPPEEEIKDRSKADSFSKLVVLVQTLWFVIQSIARRIEHLSITELEIATLAYTVPILGVYICWWNKPLGVTQPIRVSKSVWDGDNIDKPRPFWGSFVDSLTGEL